MNKEQAKILIESNFVKNYIDVCPHCGSKAHLEMLFNESFEEKNRDLVYYITFRCVPCKSLILKTYLFEQNEHSSNEMLEPKGWRDKFPTEDIIFIKKFKNVVPGDIINDYEEGVISLKNNCPKASVGMFRRSLQSAMIDLGANQEEDLIDQIKNLGSITSDIKDWAHNIRIFGNWGVHPQDDELKDINKEKASEVQSFLEEFFNYVYVMPNRVAKARGVNEDGEKEPDTNDGEE